jgi:hypothetical protein
MRIHHAFVFGMVMVPVMAGAQHFLPEAPSIRTAGSRWWRSNRSTALGKW